MNPPEPLNPALVREVVLQAHGDLAKVQELITAHPTLVNASWDWGGGDWETPLGSAAHMGRKDIARYLLDNGARMDIFAAAMLGYREVVAAMLTAEPHMITTLGPHGIPLLVHAQQGGDEAAGVVELLTTH
jgi:hypothetical protein